MSCIPSLTGEGNGVRLSACQIRARDRRRFPLRVVTMLSQQDAQHNWRYTADPFARAGASSSEVQMRSQWERGSSGGLRWLWNRVQSEHHRITGCHDLIPVDSTSNPVGEWRKTMERMIGKGARLNDAEKEALIEFLTEPHPN